MREHEHRRVERRLVTPPPFPVLVLPRTTLGTELVAAHDLGADVVLEVSGEVVVEPACTAGVSAIRPARGAARPRAQDRRVGVTERSLEALSLARAVAVARQHEVLDAHELLGHSDAS